jgi:hypothetical protein
VRSFIYLFFSNLCFAAIMTQDSGKSIAKNDTKLTDQKVFMESMMSEMRRVMKIEMEQVHERIDQMENRREEQPQNGRNLRRRGRVPPREEDEERMGLVLMKKKIGSPLLTIGDPEGDLEKLGIAKITTWVVLR